MNGIPLTLESLAARITSLEHDIAENHQAHGAIYSRIEAVERGHAVLNSSLENIHTILDEIKSDVKDIKERPVKRYESIVSAVMQWVVVAVLGAVAVFK